MRLRSSTRGLLRAAGCLLGLAIWLTEGLPVDAHAATQAPAPEGQRTVVGLVLSAVGALGATQIGVLKVLEELKVPIDIITGPSMGSIVGGLCAVAADLETGQEVILKGGGQSFHGRHHRSARFRADTHVEEPRRFGIRRPVSDCPIQPWGKLSGSGARA